MPASARAFVACICCVAGAAPQSAYCIFHCRIFKYHDADLNVLWKLPVQLTGESVHHCYDHLPKKKQPQKNGPCRPDWTQSTAEREQSMASGPGVVPTLPLLITQSPKHRTKEA